MLLSSSTRRLLAGVVTGVTLMGASAGAASAAPAHFVTTGAATFSGTNITLTRDGLQPKTCPTFSLPGQTTNGGTQGLFYISLSPVPTNTCDGKPFRWGAGALGSVNAGAYSFDFFDQGAGIWGDNIWNSGSGYTVSSFSVPFTNPLAPARAKLTFSNTPIAKLGSGYIRMTGTLTATSATVALAP